MDWNYSEYVYARPPTEALHRLSIAGQDAGRGMEKVQVIKRATIIEMLSMRHVCIAPNSTFTSTTSHLQPLPLSDWWLSRTTNCCTLTRVHSESWRSRQAWQLETKTKYGIKISIDRSTQAPSSRAAELHAIYAPNQTVESDTTESTQAEESLPPLNAQMRDENMLPMAFCGVLVKTIMLDTLCASKVTYRSTKYSTSLSTFLPLHHSLLKSGA